MQEYDAIAFRAIQDLLQAEHAAVWLEIQAKLADRPYHDPPNGILLKYGINPHHLSNARRELLKEDIIEQISQPTRGGGAIDVLALKERRRQKTAFEKVAARKRLLQARYLSWTKASGSKPNLIGEAGERVTNASLREATAAGVGYHLLNPVKGEVRQLFNHPIPGGPLDNAAHIVAFKQGLPLAVTILIEVKNVRHWIYPSSAELFQLLDKAAQLQIMQSSQHFLPVLVCRRAHYTTFQMAKDLGFMVVPLNNQPILPHSEASAHALSEVRNELGYDLIQTADAHPLLTTAFMRTIPHLAVEVAERWATTAPNLASFYKMLRLSSLDVRTRSSRMDKLRDAATAMAGVGGQW